MAQVWARTIGKVLFATFGAIVLALGLALAKHQVHSIAHVDSKYFDNFINLFAVIVAPFLYVSIFMVLLGIFALLQFVGLIVIIAFKIVKAFLPSYIDPQRRYNRQMYWHKIRYGKKPRVLPQQSLFPLEDILMLMRPFGTLAVVATLGSFVSGLNFYSGRITDLVVPALIRIQYESDSRCNGLDADTRVVYLDRGNVSTARLDNGRYIFSVASCEMSSHP